MKLSQIYNRFPTKEDCIKYLECVRWKGNQTCPYCSSPKYSKLSQEHRYHCNICNTSYSVTVRTIFNKTKIDLQKWIFAICVTANRKQVKGISIRKLSKAIKVNRNTAWYMLKRITRAFMEQRDLMVKILEDSNIGDIK